MALEVDLPSVADIDATGTIGCGIRRRRGSPDGGGARREENRREHDREEGMPRSPQAAASSHPVVAHVRILSVAAA